MKINKSLSTHALIGLTIFSFSACSKVQQLESNLNEMHDATVSMNQKMDKTNSGMNVTNENVTDTLLASRHVFAAQRREAAFNGIIEADSSSEKFANAIEFMYAMEFQAWFPTRESVEIREVLFEQSIREFMNKTASLRNSYTETSGTSCSGSNIDLCVVAGALHEIDKSTQLKLLKDTPYKPVSMLTLFSEGIEVLHKTEKGEINFESLPRYQQQLLFYKDELISILQLRHNFLLAYAYSLMTQKNFGDSASHLSKIFNVIKSGVLNYKWTPHFNQMGIGEIKRISEIIDYVIETRTLLKSNEIALDVDKKIQKIYQNINWEKAINTIHSSSDNDLGAIQRKLAIEALKAKIENLLSL